MVEHALQEAALAAEAALAGEAARAAHMEGVTAAQEEEGMIALTLPLPLAGVSCPMDV